MKRNSREFCAVYRNQIVATIVDVVRLGGSFKDAVREQARTNHVEEQHIEEALVDFIDESFEVRPE